MCVCTSTPNCNPDLHLLFLQSNSYLFWRWRKTDRLVSLRESTQLVCLLKVFFKEDTSVTQFCIICWLQAKFLFTSFQWNSTLFKVLFTSIAICLVIWNLSMSFVIGNLSVSYFFPLHIEKKKQVKFLVSKYNFLKVNFKIGNPMA